MLFHVYGGNGIYQWIAMLAVLAGLILLNEFARRTKFGGLMMFGIIPLASYRLLCCNCSMRRTGRRMGSK